jgi:hypothetical protein
MDIAYFKSHCLLDFTDVQESDSTLLTTFEDVQPRIRSKHSIYAVRLQPWSFLPSLQRCDKSRQTMDCRSISTLASTVSRLLARKYRIPPDIPQHIEILLLARLNSRQNGLLVTSFCRVCHRISQNVARGVCDGHHVHARPPIMPPIPG